MLSSCVSLDLLDICECILGIIGSYFALLAYPLPHRMGTRHLLRIALPNLIAYIFLKGDIRPSSDAGDISNCFELCGLICCIRVFRHCEAAQKPLAINVKIDSEPFEVIPPYSYLESFGEYRTRRIQMWLISSRLNKVRIAIRAPPESCVSSVVLLVRGLLTALVTFGYGGAMNIAIDFKYYISSVTSRRAS